MQKISSIHIFILEIKQILEPHKLRGHTNPKKIEVTSSFHEFVSKCKKSGFSQDGFPPFWREGGGRREEGGRRQGFNQKLKVGANIFIERGEKGRALTYSF